MANFPGGLVVKISPFNAGSLGSIPGQEVKILHAFRMKNQDIRQKQYCNKFNEDFLNGPHFFNLKKKINVIKSQDFLPIFSLICPKPRTAGQEATVKTGHGTIDWFQIGKGVRQGCILSPCLFNLYAEYIMRNAGLDEAQAGIKIAGRNINNLRYADDTTLMAESEEELKSLLMKEKEESGKVGLKLNIQKTKIMSSGPITSWEIDGETVSDFIFGGSKITADGD